MQSATAHEAHEANQQDSQVELLSARCWFVILYYGVWKQVT